MDKEELQKNAHGDLDEKLLKETLSEWGLNEHLFEEEQLHYLGKSGWGVRIISPRFEGRTGNKSRSVVTDTRLILITHGESGKGIGKESSYAYYSIPYSKIHDVDYNDGLTKSSITVHTTDDYTVTLSNGTFQPSLKFRFNRFHYGSNAEEVADYIESKSKNPPKRHLQRTYEAIRDQGKQLVGSDYNIRKPDSFNDELEAKKYYQHLSNEFESWSEAVSMYKSVLELGEEIRSSTEKEESYVSVPDPDTFSKPEDAKAAYTNLRQRIKSKQHELSEQRSELIEEMNELSSILRESVGETKYSTNTPSIDVFHPIPEPSEFESQEAAKERYDKIAEQISQLHTTFEIAIEYRSMYPELPFGKFLNSVVSDLDDSDPSQIETWHEVITATKEILDFLSKVNTNHPSVSEEEWHESISLALEEEFPNVLRPIRKQVNRMGSSLWDYDDFEEYSWQEFEILIGTLYESLGYDTKVTSETADMGIDVWAIDDGKRVAIQVKHYQRGNTVGRETLQKLSSTLAKGDADRVVVVTTSTFTRTAKEWSEAFGPEVELVNGNDLVDMLNNSDVPPP